MSNRQEILEVLQARLAAIQIANGFQTDAGLHVFTHETPDLGPDDPEQAVAMVVGEDEPFFQGEQVFLKMPVEMQAVVKADLDTPYVTVEAILADIKKAIELPDRTLGKRIRHQIERQSTRTLLREPGSETVGVGITYVCPYTEVWGNP
jgi:hypothetical protein